MNFKIGTFAVIKFVLLIKAAKEKTLIYWSIKHTVLPTYTEIAQLLNLRCACTHVFYLQKNFYMSKTMQFFRANSKLCQISRLFNISLCKRNNFKNQGANPCLLATSNTDQTFKDIVKLEPKQLLLTIKGFNGYKKI